MISLMLTKLPNVHWAPNRRYLMVKEEKINMADLPIFYDGLMKQAKELFHELTQGVDVALPNEDLFIDNLPEVEVGYSMFEQGTRPPRKLDAGPRSPRFPFPKNFPRPISASSRLL
jgi:hypothetical protein